MKHILFFFILVIFSAPLTTISSQANAEQEPVWDANIVVLESEKLADGVYAYFPNDAKSKETQGIPLATSGGFIFGDKSVLMIDTMLNKRLSQQAQALISKTTSLPILYAVNTSYHGDHSYGNMYLPDTTLIIQHEVTEQYIQNHFDKDTQFMMQNFGQGRGIEDIKPTPANILIPRQGKLLLDLGNKKVEIIDFGFAQTGGDLFVWEPQSKVMWTGNAISAIKPALPWLLDGHLLDTLASFKRVYDFLPDDARVVPGHGSVIKRADIKWHIDYLEAVKQGVLAALKQGLTLEQTIKTVTLDEFRGYALFDWVHPSLSVPAAYKELKAQKDQKDETK
ncbi:MBL fold metallo-hydrolase [Thalassotalea maritima]|uniref:MBL fold metallo-hydrolase n=1 Tax=Thalassotalea maritima TaxID=3242416 RepID=UPI003526EC79